MRQLALRILLLSAIAPAFSLCQTLVKTPAPNPIHDPFHDPFHNEPLVFEHSETTIRMHADGTGERATHVLVRIQSAAAAQQFGLLAFDYASASETATITLVRVHKPNGSVVDTPPTDAVDLPAAFTREAPLYSDLKEKRLAVNSLSMGDTLEYEVDTSIDKPQAPGQFWGIQHFTPPGTVIVLAEVFTLEVPVDKYVQVWSPNHRPAITERDGVRSYRWEVAQLVAASKSPSPGDKAPPPVAPKDPDQDADGSSLPSVAWTTFYSWAAVGDWYRNLAIDRAQPNDALRARADEITRDARTPQDQVRAIYSFVSTQTRYVGIDFGVGRYQPHTAEEVLANGYGDCKDKDTLLEALLRARGFTTAPALIGVGIPLAPEVPTPAAFNHVLTTVELPGGRIWLDSTVEVAPYRLLPAEMRDQPALVMPTNKQAVLERTPAAAPYPFIVRFELAGALDAQGKLISHVTASYRTDDEMIVRTLARSVAPAQWDKASQYLSANSGFDGITSNTSFTNPDDLSSPIVVTYDYTRNPYGDWENRRIVAPLPAAEFDMLASDSSEPPADIELGSPRTLIAICRILLPEGYRARLPDPVHVRTDFATFDKTYSFDGKEIVVERHVIVLKNKLPKEEWKQYQAFTKDIGLESEPWIQLIRPLANYSKSADGVR